MKNNFSIAGVQCVFIIFINFTNHVFHTLVATMDENEWGEGFPTITSLFIPISLPRKLYAASAQNSSNSISAEILSIPNFITPSYIPWMVVELFNPNNLPLHYWGLIIIRLFIFFIVHIKLCLGYSKIFFCVLIFW